MVNTFLVDIDFIQSARLLDRRRLPNQRREAFQILCHVQRLTAMGQLLESPYPKDPYLWYNWIRCIVKAYQQWSHDTSRKLVRMNGQWNQMEKNYVIGTNDIDIRFGYIYHPAVLMWLGYEEALKSYLNAHILVTTERGIQNKMVLQEVSNPLIITRPPWTYDYDFITRHRSVLLKKELIRNETPWYQLKSEFTTTLTTTPLYYWPFTPKIGSMAKNQGESDHSKKYLQGEKSFPMKLKLQLKMMSTSGMTQVANTYPLAEYTPLV